MGVPRESAVLQLVRQHDEKHEQGHKRLREDYRGHEDRLLALERTQQDQSYTLKSLAAAAPDLSRMTLSPGIVVSIIMAIVGIVGGQVASTWGMRSDIRDISTRIESQANRNQDAQRLQDERFSAMREKIDSFDKKQELQRLEIQSLKETILDARNKR